ncbi:MAG: PaaI family thioesterase [Candidatus Thorarchaeota archaeon]
MKQLNPKWCEWISPLINSSPFFKFMGIKLNEFRFGDAFLELEIKKEHIQLHGVVHGGVLAAMIDAAGALAAVTQIEGPKSATTIEMKINYLSSAKKGKLFAHGHCIKLGKTIGVSEATISDINNKIIAYGIVTIMLTSAIVFQEEDEIPPKFS